MKNSLQSVLFIFGCVSSTFAQKEDFVWMMGGGIATADSSIFRSSRFDFTADTVQIAYVNKNTGFRYFNTSVCSKQGILSCFSNGEIIFNRNYDIMENGENLYSGADYSHGYPYQGFMLLPKPGDSTLLVHFNGNTQLVTTQSGVDIANVGLLYAEINMTANNGLGKVVLRDKKVCDDTLAVMSFSAVRHGNGRDWWILAPHFIDTTIMYRFLLSPIGLQKVGTQKINSTIQGIGSSFFSPDGAI
jgi:hypothetical protein